MKLTVSALILAGCALALPQTLRAQQWANPMTNCLSESYDPSNYNWLTYRNNCSEAVYVTVVARDGSSYSGSFGLRPGQKNGTGFTRSEVSRMGGMEAYACPYAYNPVDTSGDVINEPVSEFRCKRASDR